MESKLEPKEVMSLQSFTRLVLFPHISCLFQQKKWERSTELKGSKEECNVFQINNFIRKQSAFRNSSRAIRFSWRSFHVSNLFEISFLSSIFLFPADSACCCIPIHLNVHVGNYAATILRPASNLWFNLKCIFYNFPRLSPRQPRWLWKINKQVFSLSLATPTSNNKWRIKTSRPSSSIKEDSAHLSISPFHPRHRETLSHE